MKKFVAMLLALVMTLSLAACGQKNDTNDTKDDANSDTKELTYAVEAGSAGEAELNALGYSVTPVSAQSDALMEVAAGTSDAAVIDSLMAAAMVGEGTGYANLTYTCGLNSEEYGVGFRKGSDLVQKLNDFFKASYADGSMLNLSIGKYYTPQGRSLTDTGVIPDIEITLSDEDDAKLYYGQLEKADDAQLQAAIREITQKLS